MKFTLFLRVRLKQRSSKNSVSALYSQAQEAIEKYGMIESGARWLVCLSSGKDSYTLLAVLYELKWRVLLPFELIACNLDQGQPGFPATLLPKFLTKMGVKQRI